MRYNTPKRSTEIPNFILNGLTDPKKKRAAQLIGEVEAQVAVGLRQGQMNKQAFMRHIPNIRHGAGVYEAQHDMSIWELQGDTIVRRNDSQMEVEAVLSALEANEDEENING